jgi:hypothetical protein
MVPQIQGERQMGSGAEVLGWGRYATRYSEAPYVTRYSARTR